VLAALVVALARALAVAAACGVGFYLALAVFHALTPGINEWHELSRGNAAVGVVMGAVALAVAVVVRPVVGIQPEVLDVGPARIVLALLFEGMRLLLGILAAVVVVSFAVALTSLLTGELNEKLLVQQGNTAVGWMLAGVIVGAAALLSEPVSALISLVLRAIFA
jgi:uncharacterized membrane protein YjfL (UPF0719 family)